MNSKCAVRVLNRTSLPLINTTDIARCESVESVRQRQYTEVAGARARECVGAVHGCVWGEKIVFCFMLKHVKTLYDVAVHYTCTTTLDGAPRGQIVFPTVRCTLSARVCKSTHKTTCSPVWKSSSENTWEKKLLRNSTWNARFHQTDVNLFLRESRFRSVDQLYSRCKIAMT